MPPLYSMAIILTLPCTNAHLTRTVLGIKTQQINEQFEKESYVQGWDRSSLLSLEKFEHDKYYLHVRVEQSGAIFFFQPQTGSSNSRSLYGYYFVHLWRTAKKFNIDPGGKSFLDLKKKRKKNVNLRLLPFPCALFAQFPTNYFFLYILYSSALLF